MKRGANRGIGRAFVGDLIEKGASKVYATARDKSNLKDVVSMDSGRVDLFASYSPSKAAAPLPDGTEDVFPDSMAEEMRDQLARNPKEVENQNAALLSQG